MNTFRINYETEQKQDLTTQMLLLYADKLSNNLLDLDNSCDVLRVLCDFKSNDDVKVGIENAVQKVLAEAKKSLEDVANGFVASVFNPEINGLDGKALKLIGEVDEAKKETKEVLDAQNVEERSCENEIKSVDVQEHRNESVNQIEQPKQAVVSNADDEEKEQMRRKIEELEQEKRQFANREQELIDRAYRAEDEAHQAKEAENLAREAERREKEERERVEQENQRLEAQSIGDIDDNVDADRTMSMRAVGNNQQGQQRELNSFSAPKDILKGVQNRNNGDISKEDEEDANNIMTKMFLTRGR